MNKETFLNILKDGLSDFPEGSLADILYDYKEHFEVGFSSGKSEEEIISELGDPNDIVFQYRNGYLKKYDSPDVEDSFDDFNDFSEIRETEFINEANYEDVKFTHSNQEDNNYSNDSEKNTNDYTYTKESKKTTNKNVNNMLLGIIVLILAGTLFGPFAVGMSVSVIGVLISLVAAFFALSIGGIGILVGKVMTNTIGIFVFPAFILDFPNSVIAFIVLGSILGLLLFSICTYYFIKLCARLCVKFINWITPLIKGEK